MSFWRRNREARISERMRDAIVSLTVDEASVLDLYYCGGRTIPDIAQFLDKTNDEVENHLQQGSLKFQKRLQVPDKWLEGLTAGEILKRYFTGPPDDELEYHADRVWSRLKEDMKKYDLEFRSLYRNGQNDGEGLRDLQVLAAIDLLGREGTFDKISATLNQWSSGQVETKFVKAALDRLLDRTLITSHFSDASKSNDAPQGFFKLTSEGRSKLSAAPKQALARVKGGEWDRADDLAWFNPL